MTEAQRTRAFQFLERHRESKTNIGLGGMAGRLGVSRTCFSNYRRLMQAPPEELILKYCSLMKIDFSDTLQEQAS